MSSWGFSDLIDAAGYAADDAASYASNAFNYIKDNEWAGDLVAGAAGAAGSYLMQEDQQKHDRDMLREKRSYEVNVNNVAPGEFSMTNYGAGLTQNGLLTNGALAKKG